jgi:hypothetical protein
MLLVLWPVLTSHSHCKPGGFFEIHDLCTRIRSDHEPIPKDSQVDKWCGLMREGILKMDRHLDLDFESFGKELRSVGFVDVVVSRHQPRVIAGS